MNQCYFGGTRALQYEKSVDLGKDTQCIGERHDRRVRHLDKAALSIRAVTSTIGMTRS